MHINILIKRNKIIINKCANNYQARNMIQQTNLEILMLQCSKHKYNNLNMLRETKSKPLKIK